MKKRTTMHFDKDLIKEFKVWCILRKVTMSSVLERLIKKTLNETNPSKIFKLD